MIKSLPVSWQMVSRYILLVLGAFLMLSAAQVESSEVTRCMGGDHTKWTKCFGVLRAGLAGTYYGEFLDGKKDGLGIEIKFDGSVIKGKWEKGLIVEFIE